MMLLAYTLTAMLTPHLWVLMEICSIAFYFSAPLFCLLVCSHSPNLSPRKKKLQDSQQQHFFYNFSVFLITWLLAFKNGGCVKFLSESRQQSSLVQTPPQFFTAQWKRVRWLQGSFFVVGTKIRSSLKSLSSLKELWTSWKSWCAGWKSFGSVCRCVCGY